LARSSSDCDVDHPARILARSLPRAGKGTGPHLAFTSPCLNRLGHFLRGFVFFLLFAAPLAASCQSFISIPLSACLYHVGDDPAWASPSLDDHAWLPYNSWRAPGPHIRLWVRCHADLHFQQPIANPVIQVWLASAYELHLDGQPIAQFGNIRSGNFSLNAIRSYPISPVSLDSRPHLVALRVNDCTWHYGAAPITSLMSRPLELRMGDPESLENLRAQIILTRVSGYAGVTARYGIIGVLSFPLFILFLFDRSRTVLLLFAIASFSLACLRLNEFAAAAMLPYSMAAALTWASVFNLGVTWTQFPFFFALANRRLPIWVRILLCFASVSVLPTFLDALGGDHVPQWFVPFAIHGIRTATFIVFPLAASMPFVAFWPYSKIPPRMRALAALCLVWAAVDMSWFLIQFTNFSLREIPNLYARWGLTLLNFRGIVTVCVVAALVALLFREQRQISLDRALLAGEMHAAREIQRMLAPVKLDTAPGLHIDVAFHPMREVGGDFYSCRVLPNGVQRILLGDVSGKGAAAAMAATLLLGAAEDRNSDSPVALLSHLNRVLCRANFGGFATCLCADITLHGDLVLANAGHLNPFQDGRELATPSSLPLGIITNTDYADTHIQLHPGDALTFISDGVVEARNASGELFGFDRTAAISKDSAEIIARAASTFGQEDDITVLTVALAAPT
jgi:hypothetical protein